MVWGQSARSTGWAFGVVRLKHSRSRPAVKGRRGRVVVVFDAIGVVGKERRGGGRKVRRRRGGERRWRRWRGWVEIMAPRWMLFLAMGSF